MFDLNTWLTIGWVFLWQLIAGRWEAFLIDLCRILAIHTSCFTFSVAARTIKGNWCGWYISQDCLEVIKGIQGHSMKMTSNVCHFPLSFLEKRRSETYSEPSWTLHLWERSGVSMLPKIWSTCGSIDSRVSSAPWWFWDGFWAFECWYIPGNYWYFWNLLNSGMLK